MDKAGHLKGFKGDWQEVITKIVDNFNEIHVKSVNRLSIFNYWFLNIVFLSKTPIKSQNQFFLTIPAWTTFRQLPYRTQPTEQHWILHKSLEDVIQLSPIEILLLVILEWCLSTMTLYRSKKLVKESKSQPSRSLHSPTYSVRSPSGVWGVLGLNSDLTRIFFGWRSGQFWKSESEFSPRTVLGHSPQTKFGLS